MLLVRRSDEPGYDMHRVTKLFAAIAATLFLLGAAGCSSSSSTARTQDSTSTTKPASDRAPYAEQGPFAVGTRTLHLADGRRVVVWYPVAKADTAGYDKASVDIVSLLSPELQAKIPAADRVKYPVDAYVDAPARANKGGWPVVVFSHGYAGFPEQSVTLTTHLASWGFLVAAPDHVERSLDGLLGTAAKGVAKSSDPEVLRATLDLIEHDSNDAASPLHGLADPSKVAVAGHSAGASAAYETAAADPRFKAFISYSVGFGDKGGASAQIPAPPEVPGMVMLGTHDGIIPPAATEQVYAKMNRPKVLVKIAGAGHLVFSDICLIGGSKGGIVNIAKSLKLPIPASLLKLGSDGCGTGYPPVDKAFPAIDQLSVAFLRAALGLDAEPKGLSTAAVRGLGTPVTVTVDW